MILKLESKSTNGETLTAIIDLGEEKAFTPDFVVLYMDAMAAVLDQDGPDYGQFPFDPS